MVDKNVDPNLEELKLGREELFGYLDMLRNSPPPTLSKKK